MPTCTVAALVEAQPCFQFPTTDDQTKFALLVYFNAAELAALGGTNYLSTLTTTLITDSDIYNTLTGDQLGVADSGSGFPGVSILTINYTNANTVGAALSTSIQTLTAAVKTLRRSTWRQLAQAYLLLQCKLGRHTGS